MLILLITNSNNKTTETSLLLSADNTKTHIIINISYEFETGWLENVDLKLQNHQADPDIEFRNNKHILSKTIDTIHEQL